MLYITCFHLFTFSFGFLSWLDSMCHGSLASEPIPCLLVWSSLEFGWAFTPALMKRAIGENELWSILSSSGVKVCFYTSSRKHVQLSMAEHTVRFQNILNISPCEINLFDYICCSNKPLVVHLSGLGTYSWLSLSLSLSPPHCSSC